MYIDERFSQECPSRKVLTLADMTVDDTYANFEIVEGEITETVQVFHPTLQTPDKDWNIVESTYPDFWSFVTHEILPTKQKWA